MTQNARPRHPLQVSISYGEEYGPENPVQPRPGAPVAEEEVQGNLYNARSLLLRVAADLDLRVAVLNRADQITRRVHLVLSPHLTLTLAVAEVHRMRLVCTDHMGEFRYSGFLRLVAAEVVKHCAK